MVRHLGMSVLAISLLHCGGPDSLEPVEPPPDVVACVCQWIKVPIDECFWTIDLTNCEDRCTIEQLKEASDKIHKEECG